MKINELNESVTDLEEKEPITIPGLDGKWVSYDDNKTDVPYNDGSYVPIDDDGNPIQTGTSNYRQYNMDADWVAANPVKARQLAKAMKSGEPNTSPDIEGGTNRARFGSTSRSVQNYQPTSKADTQFVSRVAQGLPTRGDGAITDYGQSRTGMIAQPMAKAEKDRYRDLQQTARNSTDTGFDTAQSNFDKNYDRYPVIGAVHKNSPMGKNLKTIKSWFDDVADERNAIKEAGVGKIVKGVNTTPDVQPGETERQAKKLFPMNKNGKPKSMGVKGATPNQAFNLGLVESEDKKDTLKGMDAKTVKAINNLMIKFPHAKDPITAIIADIEDSQEISIRNDKNNELRDKTLKHRVEKLEMRLSDLEKKKTTDISENMSVTGTERRRAEKKKGIEIGSPEWFKHWFDLPYLREDISKQELLAKLKDQQRGRYIKAMMDAMHKLVQSKGTKHSIGSYAFEIGKVFGFDGKELEKMYRDMYMVENASPIQKVDIEQLEKFADRLFGKVGIDVEFTRHFMDRVNDVRNKKPITMSELTRLFKQEYKRWGKPIAQMGPNSQAVMKDLQTDINLPFVLQWDDKNNELDLIAKTIMRKADFKTPNKEFPVEDTTVENVPTTNKPGSIGQHINWAGKNVPDKPKSNVSVARRKQQEPQSWWQTMLAKGKGMFEDEQLDLKKKFEITDELSKLANIFNRGGHEIRIVGGAVRDLALDKTPKDIDLASDATPTEMQKMFDSAGVRHIPTGIEHGTITAVINGEEFEITTLRADVETDGRRAEVEFVRSWEEDAKRRDLTYNAMSIDFEGNLYDYHGGMDDLQDKVTRFVGDPEERIQEDYLRTLRYFRFQGRLDTPTFDRDTMQAIASNTDGLKQLSVERVWMEMGKILSGSNIQQILGAMQKTGVLGAIGLDVKPSQDIMDGGDPIINLARITDDESVGLRWKMSNEEKGKLGFLISQKGQTHDKKWYTDQMADGFDRTQLDALARYNNQDDMIAYIKSFKAPDFPVDGNDLMQLGHARGPGIGKTLQALRTQWKQGNFSANKDELLKGLDEDIQNTNDLEHMINRVGVVADICTKMGNKPLMYRQFKGAFNNAHKFAIKVTPQENREVHGNKVNPAQQKVTQALGIKNPVWATLEPHAGTRGPFGENNIMIPIGNYKIHYSSEVQDLGRKDDVEQFLDTYKTGWPDSSHGDNEIMVDCDTYYLINVGDFVGKYAGKKAKDIINIDDRLSSNDWSNLNTEMLKAKFNTYKDVGWYLANPVTNYIKWMDKTQKERSAKMRSDFAAQKSFATAEAVGENFADGKKPGRKGLSKRVGIPKDATLAQLEKIAKNSSGEKRRMAQWQLNMRRGKNK